MDIAALVRGSRSFRRFDESRPITMDDLKFLVELARYTPSAKNMQPLQYVLCAGEETNAKLFKCLGWAGYLPHWPGPSEGQRPTGYIVLLHDKDLEPDYTFDQGIVAQTMMLGAASFGFGGCMIASVNRDKVRAMFDIPERFDIPLVLALGTPGEEVVVTDIEDDNVKYWHGEDGRHYVPKRQVEDMIFAKYTK